MPNNNWDEYKVSGASNSLGGDWDEYKVKKKGYTLPEYGSTLVQYGTGLGASQPRKYIPPKTKAKSLSEASSDDNSYIAALWNQIPSALSDAVGGLSKFGGKLLRTVPGISALETGIDVGAQIAGRKDAINPVRRALRTESLESFGKSAERIIEKAKSPYASKEYEEKLLSGLDVTGGIGLEDIKAAPLFITRMAADAGLAIPSFGSSFVAQGYNQGLKEYDEVIKNNPEYKNDSVREIFGVTYGTINGLLDKLGLDAILKTPAVTKAVKKFILNDALKTVAKSTSKEITSEGLERAAQDASRRTFNKIKDLGVKGLFAAGAEGVTEPLQGGLSDGLKVITNKISGSEIFNEKELKENFWKNRINEAAAGAIGGATLSTAMRGLKSSDKYIAERVAESASPENIEFVKLEIDQSVQNGELTEDDAARLNTALDAYASASNRLPSNLGTEQRAKAITAMAERDSLAEQIKAIKESTANVDQAIVPELENEVAVFQNKIEFLNDQIIEAVTGKKYKYFQDDTGRSFKQLVKPGSNLAKAIVSPDYRAEKSQQIPIEYYEFVTQDESIPDEYKPKSVKEKKIDTFVDRIIAGGDPTSDKDDRIIGRFDPESNEYVISLETESDIKFYQDNKDIIDQKVIDYAVQEQTAGEVSVQPEARVGEEVAQGEPQTELEETAKVEEVIPDEDLDIAIENLSNIKAQNKKLERATLSKRSKEMADKSIKDSETQLSSINEGAFKRAKDIEDNFDDIKDQLKEKGLLTSLQKGCL
jgi:hypothetical protein